MNASTPPLQAFRAESNGPLSAQQVLQICHHILDEHTQLARRIDPDVDWIDESRIDSLELLDFLLILEGATGVCLTEADLPSLRTLNELSRHVANRTAAR
jgi:acyl carrier protein